jgi:hypothetical protein
MTRRRREVTIRAIRAIMALAVESGSGRLARATRSLGLGRCRMMMCCQLRRSMYGVEWGRLASGTASGA